MSEPSRKICFVTASGADFGLLFWPMGAIEPTAGRTTRCTHAGSEPLEQRRKGVRRHPDTGIDRIYVHKNSQNAITPAGPIGKRVDMK